MPDKKTSVKKNTDKSHEDVIPSKSTWAKQLFIIGIKLSFALFCLLAIYTIYLDAKVQKTFEGNKWQVPIQVFGQIIEFSKDDKLDVTQLKKTLIASGYKKVTRVSHAGEFALSASRAIIYRRGFNRGIDAVTSEIITIDLSNEHISQILVGGNQVERAQLEPILLDRVLPETKEDRILVSLEQVPEKLLDTLILVEDRDYYFHSGISPLGIIRAFYNNLRAGHTVQGGSTLTQQLVKNMFLTRHKTLWRKANEAIMALLLEYRYSKDTLLEAYINEVYLGQHYANGIYGFGLAAQFYFGKTIGDLNNEQMAMLVGIIKGPSYYDPWRHPEKTKKRRDLVLQLQFKQQQLSKSEYVQAIESPLSIRQVRRLKKQKYPSYIQLVKNELRAHLNEGEQQSGITIFTGFSLYSQQLLEHSLALQLPLLEQKHKTKQLQAAMVVTDIHSGEIKALVGDRVQGYAGFNRALHAIRPIGSLIKPSIYLAALERYEQYNLATVLADKAIVLNSDVGKEWRPKNYDGKFRGQVSLLEGLTYSLNIPTVNLGMKLGLNRVVDAIHLLGYKKEIITRPSMLLGAVSMSPIEVNQFYLPIAAKGRAVDGHVIKQILSGKEETLWQSQSSEVQLISEQGSFLIDYALTQVAQKGTARSLSWRLKDKIVAGKTGTTNDQRDSWFVGYDNRYLVTTWLGRDDNKPTSLTGSSGALVLYADFMTKLGVTNKQFLQPKGVSLTLFEKNSGNVVTDQCANTQLLPAISASLLIQQTCLEQKEVIEERSWYEKLFGN